MAGNPITKIIITAKDEASSVFSSLQTKVAGIAAAIAGYFGVKMFGDAIGSAMDFEAAMSRVQAASGASGAELGRLKTAAEEAGATTKYTSTQAAEALENLAKSGLTASQAVDALPAVLSLAQAGGVELGTAAEYVTKAVNGMGLSFAEAGRVADVLALGANASNTSVDGLAQALSYAAPLANSLGLSLEETVAIIGKFADAGIDAGRAGTALNSILAQFSDPASKFREALANAGIITDDFGEALRQLAAAGPAGAQAITAVGQEAGPALRALLNQGIGALDELTGKLQNAEGSAEDAAGVMGGNLAGAMAGLSSAWDAVRRALVEPLLAPLAAQVQVLSAKFLEAVSDGTELNRIIKQFGEAIRVAFESGVKFFQGFISTVDFAAVSARLQEFAARAGEVFTAIGNHGTTAGGVLQTAYGVMSTGLNVVLASIYKVGEGASWLASAFLADLALISEGIAKITFGSLSEGFAQAAASMRAEAQAAYAVSDEFARKSTEAFAAAAEGAETAANGWKTLTGAATEAAPAVTAAGAAIEAAGTQAAAANVAVAETAIKATDAAAAYTALGVSASAAAEQYVAISESTGVTVTSMRELEAAVLEGRLQFDETTKSWKAGAGELPPLTERMSAAEGAAGKLAESIKATSTTSTESAKSLATLRDEYKQLIAEGNLQAAAEKLQQIDAAMKGVGKEAKYSAEQVATAFERLQITSTAKLQGLAENARRDFNIIKDSGQGSARDIQAAFTAYAEKAIAANGGVVDATLQSEAAQNGLRISADEAGKVIVQSMSEAAAATGQIGAEAQKSAADLAAMGKAAEAAAEKAAAAASEQESDVDSILTRSNWSEWRDEELSAAAAYHDNPGVREGADDEIRRRREKSKQRAEED
ncbi:phage tail tape measure protein, partial [Aromatoleum aromaticum]